MIIGAIRSTVQVSIRHLEERSPPEDVATQCVVVGFESGAIPEAPTTLPPDPLPTAIQTPVAGLPAPFHMGRDVRNPGEGDGVRWDPMGLQTDNCSIEVDDLHPIVAGGEHLGRVRDVVDRKRRARPRGDGSSVDVNRAADGPLMGIVRCRILGPRSLAGPQLTNECSADVIRVGSPGSFGSFPHCVHPQMRTRGRPGVRASNLGGPSVPGGHGRSGSTLTDLEVMLGIGRSRGGRRRPILPAHARTNRTLVETPAHRRAPGSTG